MSDAAEPQVAGFDDEDEEASENYFVNKRFCGMDWRNPPVSNFSILSKASSLSTMEEILMASCRINALVG